MPKNWKTYKLQADDFIAFEKSSNSDLNYCMALNKARLIIDRYFVLQQQILMNFEKF